MDQIKMGKFISELRKEKGLTQKDIGDKLNITDNSVSKWERGINAPDIYYLGPLSEILGVSVKELLNGEKNARKKKKKESNRKVILETKKLSKKFGNKEILKSIDITIYEGDIVGLIGPNGAGKSTFIKTVLNLYKEDNGKVSICGINVLEVVIMGDSELYSIMKEKDALYMKADFTDEDGIRVGELEDLF